MHERTHILSCDRGVADERHFAIRREEAHFEVIVGGLRRNDKGDFRAVDLAGDAMHVLVGELVRIEDDHRRVAGESLARKGIDVEQAAGASGHAGGDPVVRDAQRDAH